MTDRPHKPTYQSLMNGPASYLDLTVHAMDAELAALDAGDERLTRDFAGHAMEYARKVSKDPNTPVAFMAMIQRKHDLVMHAIKKAIDMERER